MKRDAFRVLRDHAFERVLDELLGDLFAFIRFVHRDRHLAPSSQQRLSCTFRVHERLPVHKGCVGIFRNLSGCFAERYSRTPEWVCERVQLGWFAGELEPLRRQDWVT